MRSTTLLIAGNTGCIRGVGFVEMAKPSAIKAIAALNGRKVGGLKRRVHETKAPNIKRLVGNRRTSGL